MLRLIKEVRTLAWPAIAILTAAALPILWGASADDPGALAGGMRRLALVAGALGTALLVAQPFGVEFQQRTLGLLLMQPVTRARIWIEKWTALLAVLVPLASLALLILPGEAIGSRIVTFAVVMACSGPLWTLVAGSTIGGAVFSLAGLMLVEMGAHLALGVATGSDVGWFANHPALLALRALYATATLWLGWRMLARFEVTGSGGGAGTRAVGSMRALEILRSRPHGAIANLVRKEVRLQQPTFLVAGVFAGCWAAALAFLALVPTRVDLADALLTTLIVSYVPLTLIVASTISVGEDTALGTGAWHLTYPVSAGAQWGAKLGVTTAVAALLGLALPAALAAVARYVVALPAGHLQLPSVPATAFVGAAIVLIGFWASTLVRHTVRAAVGAGLAIAVLLFVAAIGSAIAYSVGLANHLMTSLMVQFQLSPEALHPLALAPRWAQGLLTPRATSGLATLAVLCVAGPVALHQSLTAFRTARIDRRDIGRWSVQLLVVAALAAFVPTTYIKASADQYRSLPVRELEAALKQVTAGSLITSGEVPPVVSATELDATGLLSAQSRRWLAGSRVSLVPFGVGRDIGTGAAVRSRLRGDMLYVSAHVDLASGRRSRLMFTVRAR